MKESLGHLKENLSVASVPANPESSVPTCRMSVLIVRVNPGITNGELD